MQRKMQPPSTYLPKGDIIDDLRNLGIGERKRNRLRWNLKKTTTKTTSPHAVRSEGRRKNQSELSGASISERSLGQKCQSDLGCDKVPVLQREERHREILTHNGVILEDIGRLARMSVLDTEVDSSNPAAVCCFLEQETLSALLQSTQL